MKEKASSTKQVPGLVVKGVGYVMIHLVVIVSSMLIIVVVDVIIFS